MGAASIAPPLPAGLQMGAVRRPPGPVDSVLDLVGNTPLLRLGRIDTECPGVEIWAKAEFSNPGGSVKDRAQAHL